METLIQDLRFGLRQLRRSPAFTTIAIVTLALGIGATTAIFSVVNTVLLSPLPYPDSNRLVRLELKFPRGSQASLAVPEFMAMRKATHALQDFSLYNFGSQAINLTGGDRPEQLKGEHVSANYFRLFGTTMALGRPFTPEEDRPAGPQLAVISYGLWRGRFGGDPKIVGRAIDLSGESYVITGVAGQAFEPDPPVDVWMPLQADPASQDEAHYLVGAAKLKPGATLAQANAELKVLAGPFKQAVPASRVMGPKLSFGAELLRDSEVSNVKSALLILLGAVGFLLLIACANVANLLLSRATLRKREIAIRASVGAGRWRIIRQLLTESVLLSSAGGALGLLLGIIGMRAMLAINPGNIPRVGEHGAAVGLDWRVLSFTLAVTILSGVIFGLIPALTASRSDLNSTLKESASRSGSGLRQNKARSVLVMSEMALALVLMIGAALLIRTFFAMESVDPGFNPHRVLTMDMSIAGKRFEKTAPVAELGREAERRVGAIPGVEAVSDSAWLPLTGAYDLPFDLKGHPGSEPGSSTGDALWAFVSPEYFKAFQIPLLRGRAFTDQDTASAPRVAIISDAIARKYWKNGNPIGQEILIGKGVGPEFTEAPRQIVGVVGDVRDAGLNQDPPPTMYVPVAQVNDGVMALSNKLAPLVWTVRTKVPPFTLSKQIQEQLRVASGGLPVGNIRSMDQIVAQSAARENFNTALLSIFAAVALLLAAIGIYGVISYSVEQRTQEIGIRMALGASPRAVRNMIVSQGMRLALAGIGVGVAGAFGLTRLIKSMLFGVTAHDPLVFVSLAILLAGVALLATYLPARRATRVDPTVALRYE